MENGKYIRDEHIYLALNLYWKYQAKFGHMNNTYDQRQKQWLII